MILYCLDFLYGIKSKLRQTFFMQFILFKKLGLGTVATNF